MVEPAPLHAVPSRMTSDASHITLRDLGHEALNRTARMREVERLLNAGAVVEVESAVAGTAIDASSFLTNLVEDRAVALDVLADAGVLRCTPHRIARLRRMALSFARLVAFPRFIGVVLSATGHMGILRALAADTWGNESFEHVEMAA